MQEVVARSVDPLARDGGLSVSRYTPIVVKAAEVIDADDVRVRERRLEAIEPPGVAGVGVAVPAVERIPSQLSGLREVVGWDSGDEFGPTGGVDLEQLSIGPHIG